MLWNILKEKMLQHPQKTVQEGKNFLTYEEIVVLAESLRPRLTKPCYAILCHSELFTAIGLLACFAAGVTALPLSYRYGQPHLQKILTHIQPPGMITDTTGTVTAGILQPSRYISPAHRPALIVCTSGTTGSPKGVMLSNKNLYYNLQGIAGYFQIPEQKRLLIVRPLTHASAITGEFLTALYNGWNICFHTEAFVPAKLLQLIKEQAVGALCATPTLLSLLGDSIREPSDLKNLEVIGISGECLTQSMAQKLYRQFPSVSFYHGYGLSEASPRVAYLPPAEFEKHGHGLRLALSGTRLKIADETGHALPAGIAGELLVKGPGVMLGYYQNPTATKKALAGGWLHTGDIAMKTSDGYYEILGRKDDLIIRAGMNIYPAEIENALRADPRVKEVSVYGFQRPGGITEIGLTIAGDFDSDKDVTKLCRKTLSSYQMPSHITRLDALPFNNIGKTKRR